MLFTGPLPFVESFVKELDAGLRAYDAQRGLSQCQRYWLSFCLMGLLMTNTLCWARFERAGLGGYKPSALSWMFHHGQIAWTLAISGECQPGFTQPMGLTEGIISTDDYRPSAAVNEPGIFIRPISRRIKKAAAILMVKPWWSWS